MSFSKNFPRTIEGVNYPKWEEVFLDNNEEKRAEDNARNENIILMKECIDDANKILKDQKLKDYQTDLINIAISLFEKRASHVVFHKEIIAKEKFDKQSL